MNTIRHADYDVSVRWFFAFASATCILLAFYKFIFLFAGIALMILAISIKRK